MSQASTVKLSIDLDMETALRLARFEVETGVGLDRLLLQAIEKWEAEHHIEPLVSREHRIPVRFDYSPRGRSFSKHRFEGLYDPDTNLLEITNGPAHFTELCGQRGSPSGMARAIVEAVNPSVEPNRDGLRDWREIGTGRALGELRRER